MNNDVEDAKLFWSSTRIKISSVKQKGPAILKTWTVRSSTTDYFLETCQHLQKFIHEFGTISWDRLVCIRPNFCSLPTMHLYATKISSIFTTNQRAKFGRLRAYLSTSFLLPTQLEMLASLDWQLFTMLTFGALHPQHDFLRCFCLLSEDWLRLTTETFLFGVISPPTCNYQ